MTTTIFILFVVAVASFVAGWKISDGRWFKILDKVNQYYIEQAQRILNSPVYVASQPSFEAEEGVCPDCGEVHDDEGGSDDNSGAN